MATIKEVTIEEHAAFIDIQQPDGSVKRYFPITRIYDVIGIREVLLAILNTFQDIGTIPYIWGTDASGSRKKFKLEVQNGELYLSDETDNNTTMLPDSIINLNNVLDDYLN